MEVLGEACQTGPTHAQPTGRDRHPRIAAPQGQNYVLLRGKQTKKMKVIHKATVGIQNLTNLYSESFEIRMFDFRFLNGKKSGFRMFFFIKCSRLFYNPDAI